MSKAEFWQKGETLDFKNAGAPIAANDVVVIGKRIGVAGTDIAAKAVGTLHVEGVFRLEKNKSDDIKAGAEVYWAADPGHITTTVGSNVLAGYAVEDAGTSATKVLVKINA